MYPRQAAEMLDELTGLRRRSLRSLGRPWFPLTTFGAITVLSSPLVALVGTIALVPFWIVFGALAMRLTAAHYARRAGTHGVTGRASLIWPIAVSMAVLCLVGGFVAGHLWGARGGVILPVLLVVVGYTMLGRVQRDIVPTLLVAGAAAGGVAAALAGARPWLVELVFGALLLTAGLVLLACDRSAGEWR